MMINVTLGLLAFLAVCSAGVPMFNRKEEYLRELAAIVQPADDTSLLKKRTYGSLSLGGSYGTAKRGGMRADDVDEVPHHYETVGDNYLRNKNTIPRIYVEPASIGDLFEDDKFIPTGAGNSRTSGYFSKSSPSEDFNQAD